MKLIYSIVTLILLFQTACISQDQNKKSNVTESNIDQLTLKEGERPLIVVDENGRKLVRIISKTEALSGGNPVYECKCTTTGDCCVPKASPPTGFLKCVCEKGCAAPVGDLNSKTSGCAFEKVADISPFIEAKFQMAAQYFEAGLPDFNESGFRAISPYQLELSDPEIDYQKITLSNGSTGILFRATGIRVQCNCSCPNGDCDTQPLGTTILDCRNGKKMCQAELNGAPCNGCEWVEVPKNVKTIEKLDPVNEKTKH